MTPSICSHVNSTSNSHPLLIVTFETASSQFISAYLVSRYTWKKAPLYQKNFKVIRLTTGTLQIDLINQAIEVEDNNAMIVENHQSSHILIESADIVVEEMPSTVAEKPLVIRESCCVDEDADMDDFSSSTEEENEMINPRRMSERRKRRHERDEIYVRESCERLPLFAIKRFCERMTTKSPYRDPLRWSFIVRYTALVSDIATFSQYWSSSQRLQTRLLKSYLNFIDSHNDDDAHHTIDDGLPAGDCQTRCTATRLRGRQRFSYTPSLAYQIRDRGVSALYL